MVATRCTSGHLNLDGLPEEVLLSVSEFVGAEHFGLLQFVSRSFQRACLLRQKSEGGNNITLTLPPFCRSASLLRWALTECGCPKSLYMKGSRLTQLSAREGSVCALEWLRSQSPPYHWDEDTCLAAAQAGQLNVLKWLRSQVPPCPWNEQILVAADEHLHILLWLMSLPHSALPAPRFEVVEFVRQAVWQQGHELAQGGSSLDPIVELLKKSCSDDSEDVLSVCLDVVNAWVNDDYPGVNDYIEIVVPVAIRAMKSRSHQVKITATACLHDIIIKRPKLLVKKNMLAVLLEGFTEVLACPIWLHSIGVEGDPRLHLLDQTIVSIDAMAQHVPTKSFFEVAMATFRECSCSSDHLVRKAGFVLLGSIVEGCTDSIRLDMSELVKDIVRATSDREHEVREASIYALQQLSQHCFPAILYHHAEIVPVIISSLQDPEPSVQRLTCILADNFIEHLQPSTVALYLSDLMPHLLRLMKDSHREVKEAAISASGPVAAGAEHHFLPYLKEAVTLLSSYLGSADECNENTILESASIEALGQYAFAVGGDNFSPYFGIVITVVLSVISTEMSNMFPNVLSLERIFVFVANIAKAINTHDKLDDYLFLLYPPVVKSLQEFDDDRVKVAAIQAIGSLAKYAVSAFHPYIDQSLNCVEEMVRVVYNPMVVGNGLRILQYLVFVVADHAGITKDSKGKLHTHNLPGSVTCILNRVLSMLYPVVCEGNHRCSVSGALDALKGIVDYFGSCALSLRENESYQPYEVILGDKLLAYLELKMPCQSFSSENDEEGEDDHHDREVLPCVCELIESMADALGGDYADTFEKYIPSLLKFTEDSRSCSDSAMAIACIANAIEKTKSPVLKFVDTLLPVVKKIILTSVEEARRNALYCLAMIVENISEEQLEPLIPDIVQWTMPVLSNSQGEVLTDTGGADKDNAVAALARIVLRCPQHKYIPNLVSLILEALPLRADYAEGVSIFNMFIMLIRCKHKVAIDRFGDILKAFSEPLSCERPYPESVVTAVKDCISNLYSEKYPGDLNVVNTVALLTSRGENAEVVERIMKCNVSS